jgi:RHS repeat-associated protein
MNALKTIAKLLLALLVVAVPAAAQQHPNSARGFNAKDSFNPGDVDSINPFNGNMVLQIPLGQTYPVNATLSYKLSLIYNNNVWDYQQVDDEFGTLTQAIPNRMSNAGLGWMVSLGRLNPPSSTDVDTTRTTYMSTDGALHTFYDTLHEGETAVSGVKYTRDGSYLRFKSATNEIELPDGTIHHFNALGYPDQIRDRFGNQLSIDYATANQWILSDGHRTHRVYFRTDLAPFGQVVDHIDLAAFNGTTATYTFRYSNDDGTPVTLTGCRNSDPSTVNQTIPLLTQVILPDGTSYRMVASEYGTQTTAPCTSGMLRGMNLPTLGRVEWDYMEYSFPQSSSTRLYRQKSTGVAKRRLLDAASPRTLLGEWVYSTALTTDANYAQPQELVNTMVTPLGDKTVHYFSVSTTSSDPLGWSAFEYGLPLTHYVTDGGSLTRYLSSRIYDCDAGAVNCVLKRSNFVTYERDAGAWTSTLEENARKNQRLVSTRTNYDDNGLMEAVVYSSFDGLGHYRQSDLYGSFGAGDTRTSFVNYNPGQTYPGAFTPPSSALPWVLNNFTEMTVTDPQGTAKTEYCFDANTGFLQRTRVLSTGGSRSGNDAVTRFTPSVDGKGNVGSEEYFGGDGAGLDTAASLCSLALPANQYQINHTYQFGALKTSQYAPGIVFKNVDRDIDANTGMVSRTRDVSGLLQAAYEYDTLGRLTWIKPAQDGWTRMIYTPATSASALAEVYTSRQVNGGGTVLAESKSLYDALGRIRQEQRRMPDGTWAARTYTYNALGWRNTVSEMGAANKITSYLNYDPFGRPAAIRPPDGVAHDVIFTYSGSRSVSRTAKVATSYSTVSGTATETAATTTETYDRQGRLIQVTEPNNVITKYEYDVGGRMKRVCQNASGASTCGQERLFTYDNRGFLLSEKHPEKGASGNGTVSYLSYDSRGHARRTTDGPNDLTYSFDRAERLTQVRETGGLQRMLKEFTFATDNPVGNYRKGKTLTAQRYNYHQLSGITHTSLITETYMYGGREGRVSQRDTQVSFNGTNTESFTQSLSWDELGNEAVINYPTCTFSPCSSAARSVTNVFTNGWLTAVSGYTGTVSGQPAGIGITYYPNGMVKDIAHSNTVVVSRANDPNGIPRPASITASKAGVTMWTTGAYQYDGTGNVWKMGTSWYEYDSLSRVKTGVVFPDPLGAGTQQKQTYSYDNYGNVLSVATQIGANPATTRSTPTSSSTNRLTGTVAYDAAGNLTSWNGATYEYDAFNRMRHMVNGAEDWVYTYTADDERIWAYNLGANRSTWTVRDLDGKVLRTFLNDAGVWSVSEDYIYRGRALLAGYLGTGQRRHFALDHLGTPRLVTNTAGNQTGYHAYYPFGEEATPFDATIDRMQFTGHERDVNSQAGATPFADDLDSMHARFYNPQTGRFTATDPVGGIPSEPRGWNRYAYTMNNPLVYTDPTGLFTLGRTPPPVGMTFTDFITVTAPPWVFGPQTIAITNPGLLNFFNFWNWLGAVGGDAPGPRGGGGGPRDRSAPAEDCSSVSYGLSVDLSTINPFTSGGGGSYGLNLQYVPGEGLNVYSYATGANAGSAGFDLGVSVTGNIGLGSGAWTGDFENVAGSFGAATFGGYYTPGDQFPGPNDPGVGWYGLQGGLSAGAPAGLGVTRTTYERLWHIGGNSSGCKWP